MIRLNVAIFISKNYMKGAGPIFHKNREGAWVLAGIKGGHRILKFQIAKAGIGRGWGILIIFAVWNLF